MGQITIKSKELEVLDKLGLEYEIKNNHAFLNDWDSLSIELSGKYAGSWRRWSNGISGRNYKDLVAYFVDQGLVSKEDAVAATGDLSEFGKSTKITKVEPYDFDHMVTNPDHSISDEYLRTVRKISQPIINRLHELNVIKQDGRDNLRFMWLDANGKYIGADVQGTTVDYEKFGKRGTIKLILPGSKGFFHIESKDITDYSQVKNVYIFEAALDLISFIQLHGSDVKSFSMFIALSGAATKVSTNLEFLEEEFGIKVENVDLFVATDNDEAGDLAYTELKNEFSTRTNVTRLLPNDGEGILMPNGIIKPAKDWNELLQVTQ